MVDVLERIAFGEDLARQASVAIVGAGGDLAQRVDRFHYFAESIHIGDFADWPRPHFFRTRTGKVIGIELAGGIGLGLDTTQGVIDVGSEGG